MVSNKEERINRNLLPVIRFPGVLAYPFCCSLSGKYRLDNEQQLSNSQDFDIVTKGLDRKFSKAINVVVNNSRRHYNLVSSYEIFPHLGTRDEVGRWNTLRLPPWVDLKKTLT